MVMTHEPIFKQGNWGFNRVNIYHGIKTLEPDSWREGILLIFMVHVGEYTVRPMDSMGHSMQTAETTTSQNLLARPNVTFPFFGWSCRAPKRRHFQKGNSLLTSTQLRKDVLLEIWING